MTRINKTTPWLQHWLDMQDRLQAGGVWSPEQEHDACGVGMIAAIDGTASRQVVDKAIEALQAIWHRGAVDADGKTGDGAGIHLEIPRDFFLPNILNIPVMWLMMAALALAWYFCRVQIWRHRKPAAVSLKMKFLPPVLEFMAGDRCR